MSELELKDKGLGPAEGIVIAELIKGSSALTALDLSCNNLLDESASAIATALAVNTSLKQIDLGDNQLSAAAWSAIFDALKHNPSNKIELWGLVKQGIDVESAKALAGYVAGSTALASLDISQNAASLIGEARIKGEASTEVGSTVVHEGREVTVLEAGDASGEWMAADYSGVLG